MRVVSILWFLSLLAPIGAGVRAEPLPQNDATSPNRGARLISLPDPDEVARYYPSLAIRQHATGEVKLDCAIRLDGSGLCHTVSETPGNLGFGPAAEALSTRFRFTPALRDGVPVESGWTSTIRFRPPQQIPSLPAHALAGPVLINVPNGDDIARFYPPLAVRLEIEGSVSLLCMVTVAGTGKDCRAVAESPPGLGFGAAGVKLADTFHFTPGQTDGAPSEQAWNTTIRFRLDDGDNPPDPPAPPRPIPAPPPEMIQLAKQVLAENNLEPSLAGAEADAASSRAECIKAGGGYCDQLAEAIRQADTEAAETLSEEMAEQVASIYSAAELRALTGDPDSPAAHAAQKKSGKVDAALAGLVARALNRAHAKISEHYCAAVSCVKSLDAKNTPEDSAPTPQ